MAAELAPSPCSVESGAPPVSLAASHSLSQLRATAHDVVCDTPNDETGVAINDDLGAARQLA